MVGEAVDESFESRKLAGRGRFRQKEYRLSKERAPHLANFTLVIPTQLISTARTNFHNNAAGTRYQFWDIGIEFSPECYIAYKGGRECVSAGG